MSEDLNPTKSPRRWFRLRLGTLMVFVLAAASASAMAAKMTQVIDNRGGGLWAADLPVLLVLGVVLSAVAIGGWRRHSGRMVLLQIAVSCGLILVLLESSLAEWDRVTRYWFQAAFALTVAGPILARRVFFDEAGTGPRGGPARGLVELLPCCGLNLLLVGLGILGEVLVLEFVR